MTVVSISYFDKGTNGKVDCLSYDIFLKSRAQILRENSSNALYSLVHAVSNEECLKCSFGRVH